MRAGVQAIYGTKPTPCIVLSCRQAKFSCHWLQPVVDDGTFLSPEFIRRKILEGASPDAPNFSAVR
jgi:hypothetical protein